MVQVLGACLILAAPALSVDTVRPLMTFTTANIGRPAAAGSGGHQSLRTRDTILKSVASDDLAAVIVDILAVAGRSELQVLLEASPDVEAAECATTVGTFGQPIGRRALDTLRIRYNPAFFQAVRRSAKTDWAVVFVLAHETAHHLVGHTAAPNHFSKTTMELEADEVAGFVLARLGASLEATFASVTAACGGLVKPCAPGLSERRKAIERGWRRRP